MQQQPKKVSIFEYYDYREYLQEVFSDLKRRRFSYSYRTFSCEAGISSHNFLPRIIRRERNLSPAFIGNIARYLKLSAREVKYLTALIAFNNCRKPSLKECFLRQLQTLRIVSEEYRIEDGKLRFFEEWYYPVVRELAVLSDWGDDFAALARRCIPRITPAQAKSAIQFLISNGFLEKDVDGRYDVADPIVSTEPEVDSAIIPRYHKVTLQQCAEALETVPKEERNYSSLTLRVSRTMYDEVKQEIFQLRKRILAMAKGCPNPEMVCFIGFQLLPRSTTQQNGEDSRE